MRQVLDGDDHEYVAHQAGQIGPIMHETYVDIKLLLKPREPILYYDIYLRQHEHM